MTALPLAFFAVLAVTLCAPGAAQTSSGPIEITHGGTYSGHWTSNDVKVAAVTIRTDEPVVLRNSMVSGRGNLINVTGMKSGAHVTVENVTGMALDPGVAGAARGSFVLATYFNELTVDHCTMTGTMFGIKAMSAKPTVLRITNNLGRNLEDRASDGHGGLLPRRPGLGHFVLLNSVSAASGAEIAWNQVVQTIGQSSTEDVFNIYQSQGTAAHPILVHDNYMEGNSSPVVQNHYTGAGLISDGPGTNGASPTTFVQFENNQVVATPGNGIAIAAGHDITASGNRIVSCGVTAGGTWYAFGAPAIAVWNYYKTPGFYNNTVTGTTGGMVGPGPGHQPHANDAWRGQDAYTNASNVIRDSQFTDPCLVNGKVNLRAEDEERARWTAKLAAARQTVGAAQAR